MLLASPEVFTGVVSIFSSVLEIDAHLIPLDTPFYDPRFGLESRFLLQIKHFIEKRFEISLLDEKEAQLLHDRKYWERLNMLTVIDRVQSRLTAKSQAA